LFRYTVEYEHVRFLGRGGFGVVFEAINKLDERRVAIKRVSLKKYDIYINIQFQKFIFFFFKSIRQRTCIKRNSLFSGIKSSQFNTILLCLE
jgi:serine/threonine protein kinase